MSNNEFFQVPETIWRMLKLQTLDLSRNLVTTCTDPTSTTQPLNASLTTLYVPLRLYVNCRRLLKLTSLLGSGSWTRTRSPSSRAVC